MIALHVVVELAASLIVGTVVLLAVCAALGSGRTPAPRWCSCPEHQPIIDALNEQPHVPADVDLAQCLDTVKAIDEWSLDTERAVAQNMRLFGAHPDRRGWRA